MTDLRAAANMALNALEFSLPVIEDFGSKEQLTDCHRAITALYKSFAQPDETETLKRCLFQMQEAAKALAQPEQKLNDPPAYVEPPTSDYHNGWEEGFEAAKNLFKKESAPQNADPRLLLGRKDNCIALAQPEPQVCCGDYEKCMKACTPRGRWLAEKELAKPEQEPVCDKDPFYCWSIRCQLGKVCKHAPSEPPFELTDAGADTNISRGLEPKGAGMVTLNQVGMRVDLKDGTRKPWVGLTDEEIDVEMYARLESETFVKGVKWAEERLKEKNGG